MPIVPTRFFIKGFQMKATHIRMKTNTKVFVERHEGNILVVRNLKGKILGSYTKQQMKHFNERYASLAVAGSPRGKRRGT